MPHNCVIKREPGLLRVEVSGGWEPGQEFGDAINVWSRVAEVCRETGESRILSVWNVPGHLPTMKAYSLASTPDSFGWKRSYKLAIVHLNEDRFNDALFAETVAVNRGYQVRIFRDEKSGREWLLGS